MDVTGKVALVSGAARRVGRAIALELARTGCDLAIHYRTSNEEARNLAAEIQRLGRRTALVSGDLAKTATPQHVIDQTVDRLGRLDILVNNASVFSKTPLAQADAAAWNTMLRVNVIAPALLARAAAPLMQSAGGGRIINLVDMLADRPVKAYGPYCASKAALANLTRTLALELAPQVTVNAVAPGIAVFPQDVDKELRSRLIARVPLSREGTPEEIAAVVRFLVIEGDYITGQIIHVDGGWSQTSV
ncbi:MAG TPA: SDR family oxidoreductase [Phycisphaerae bacterium]|nr:SDR family oxidoreductase [Phycisphaerae bacterium]HRY68012.1 SDR family oxidoreductase [Phycisphaerae bacterium]HSA26749.1 SDR family oxidoreductase [Phycisphaerae bacterium]